MDCPERRGPSEECGYMSESEGFDEGGSPLAGPSEGATDDMGAAYRVLSVFVPVYNERVTVAEVIRRIRAVDISLDVEVIVVDDGSSDGTDKVLSALSDSTVRVGPIRSTGGRGLPS